MTHTGVALMVMFAVGIGACLYYMFADKNYEHRQYGHENGGGGGRGGYEYSSSDRSDPWSNDYERSRRRKRRTSAAVDKPSCIICLVEVKVEDSVRLSPCEHEFHKSCIGKWQQQGPSETRNTCPICRGKYV